MAKKPSMLSLVYIAISLALFAVILGSVWRWFTGHSVTQPVVGGDTSMQDRSPEKPKYRVKSKITQPTSLKEVTAYTSRIDVVEAHDPVTQPSVETNASSSVNVQTNHPRKRVFKTATEEVLHMLARTIPGDSPPPIPNLPRCENLKQILDSQIVINKGDSEAVEQAKHNVAILKAHLEKHIANGGDPNDFVHVYRNWLLECSELRSSYDRHIRKTLKTEGRRQATIDLEVLNGKLKEKGIKPVVLPQRLWDAAQE